MRVEIVSHCWNYSRLLTYQLSSLVLYPPQKIDVIMTVCYSAQDERTSEVLEFFETLSVPRVKWNWLELERNMLLRRANGRNLAALGTSADWMWFADCDMCFGSGALDSLVAATSSPTCQLAFPATILISKTHELGDRAIQRLKDEIRVADLEPDEFVPHRYGRAIGGVQIVRGDISRQHGYCKGTTWLRPMDTWRRCHDDVAYRRIVAAAVKTSWQRILVPQVFRLRHTAIGRTNPNVNLLTLPDCMCAWSFAEE